MTPYDLYVFFLCLIVFVLFTATFTVAIVSIARLKLKLIRNGLEDERILTEYKKKQAESKVLHIVSTVFSVVLCVAFLVAFAFSLYVKASDHKPPNGVPSLKVVMSNSMSFKNEKNTYLTKNNLNDQLQTFDLIVVEHLPAEQDIELYDIVVYKMEDGDYIIHRIVGIEEPDENHPNCRYFLLQGDAVSNADVFPVLYSQMQGIYTGRRVPFVGSFVVFLQSPAGWLCILLILFSIPATMVLEKKFAQAEKARLSELSQVTV